MRVSFGTTGLGRACAALAVAMAMSVAPARATVMVEVPPERLVAEADAIVVGRVEHVGTRLDLSDGRSEPHTVTTLRVREWLKGAGPELVRIDEIGGFVAEAQIGMAIAGTPQYAVGDEVVVFLRDVGGVYRTYAMEQGHFVIQRGVPGVDDLVQRDLGAIGFASWARGAMEVEHGGRSAMRLDDFLAYVRATVEQLRVQGASDPLRGGR
jgi:hypothetical protein